MEAPRDNGHNAVRQMSVTETNIRKSGTEVCVCGEHYAVHTFARIKVLLLRGGWFM